MKNGITVPREPELACSMFGLGLGLGTGGGAAAAFSPLDLSPVLWLRADLGITLNGSNVSEWADQSGTGDANKNATQGTAGKQPAYNATDANFNGKPSISFAAGADNSLVTGTWAAALAQPCSVFLVGRQTGTSGSHYAFDSKSGVTQMALYGDSSRTALTAEAGTALPASTGVSAVPAIIIVEFNGASSHVHFNKAASSATGNAGTNGATGITIGNYAGGGTFSGWDIAEVVVFSSVLADGGASITSMLDYMSARYGITVAP